MKLAGRVAVVTGGGSGIGRGSSLLFAREGAKVCIVDRDAAAAEESASLIHGTGGESMARRSDVGAAGSADADAAAVLGRWGRIDVLLCAAGVFRFTLPAALPPETGLVEAAGEEQG